MKKIFGWRPLFLKGKMGVLLTLIAGFLTFSVSAETTYIYNFDNETVGACDSSATDTGNPGTNNATLNNYSGATYDYITGYSCNALKFGSGVATAANLTPANGITWGQKFVFEAKIKKNNEASGTIELIKHTANNNFRWYIDTDGKMKLSLNGGNDFNVSTTSSVISNDTWTRLCTVVDLSQTSMNNAVKMYKYTDTAINENYFGSGADGDLTISANTTWDSGTGPVTGINAFTTSLNANSGNNTNQSCRCPVYISGTGNKIRVKFVAGSGTFHIRNAAIGLQSSGANTVSTPVELTFNNGASGFTISAGTYIWSDWVTMPVSSGTYLIIHDDASDYANYAFNISGSMYYSTSNTQSYNQATPSGFSISSGSYYGFSDIEVKNETGTGDMIVKNFNTLTINSGVTLTIKGRKGCMVYVKGNFVNNGTIDVQSGYECDPSSAGVPSAGLKIIRFKSGSTETLSGSVLTGCGSAAATAEANQSAISNNGKVYTISRTGASGAAAVGTGTSGWASGGTGAAGSTLQAGGGGAGGGWSAGAGAATCFSGGAGSGGSGGYANVYTGSGGGAGSSIGGAGGIGNPLLAQYQYYAGSGAGNPGGGSGTGLTDGASRIGGLLCMFVNGTVTNAGTIHADGGSGGSASSSYAGGGGGSGGGIIMLLYGSTLSNTGTIRANGGAAGSGSSYSGGAGGAGSVLIEQIDASSTQCTLAAVGSGSTFQGAFASGTGAVATTNNAVAMLQRGGLFTLQTDFVKITTEAATATITNAVTNFYQGNTSYVRSGSSSAINLNPSALIRRVTNPPSDFNSGVPNSGVTVTYDNHPTTPSVFHGIFEINLALDTASFDGTVTVDIHIQKPGEDFKKIGQISTTKPASGAWNVKYYWNSRATAYDWTSTDAQAYRTDGLIRFKFQVR